MTELGVFWLKRRSLGPIHVCVGRNDGIYRFWRKHRASIHMRRTGRMVFITLRYKTCFINVDLV